MLGEKILEHSGKITGQRVLPSEGGTPKIETSFQANERLLGVEATTLGTYQAVARPGGILFGQGEGVIMTKEGDMATWTGQGIGRPKGRGMAASWRGCIYYQTASQKLARLNGIAAVFEYEVDENGNTQGSGWEWK